MQYDVGAIPYSLATLLNAAYRLDQHGLGNRVPPQLAGRWGEVEPHVGAVREPWGGDQGDAAAVRLPVVEGRSLA